MSLNTHYTFGDADLAADRLARLGEIFEPSLIAFVRRAAPPAAARVLDLGCGPGYTTRTLARLLSPDTIVGVDGSERFLARARSASPPAFTYLRADVTTHDVHGLDMDIVFARFLLTHLSEPAGALAHWVPALAASGRLLIQETADLSSEHPALARYYERVGELQRRHGQVLHIGCDLMDLARRAGCRVVDFRKTPLEVSASAMAELHAMNIQTWRHDAAAKDFDPVEVDDLHAALVELAADRTTAARVTYAMGEMILGV